MNSTEARKYIERFIHDAFEEPRLVLTDTDYRDHLLEVLKKV
tara:strand:- start:204 stop:329 length:126 start_codon:yes stop_codon:yes gene_type:complete